MCSYKFKTDSVGKFSRFHTIKKKRKKPIQLSRQSARLLIVWSWVRSPHWVLLLWPFLNFTNIVDHIHDSFVQRSDTPTKKILLIACNNDVLMYIKQVKRMKIHIFGGKKEPGTVKLITEIISHLPAYNLSFM